MGADSRTLEVPQDVLDYLASQPTLTLATASRGGVPRATTLTYVQDGANVYVWTRPHTTTAHQMQENPVVSFAVDEYTEDWRDTKGIQALAEAQVVLNPDELAKVVRLFAEKYPPLAGALDSGVLLVRLTPTELQFIDNSEAGTEPTAGGGLAYERDDVFNIFRDLPQEEIQTVAARMQIDRYESGETIVRQGAPADKFFVIVEGEVEVEHEEGGDTRHLATLANGQFFGEMAILRDTPRMATVRATRSTTLFTMDKDAFRSLVAQSMGTTRDFDRVVQRRLDEIRGGAAR